jgi:hypothetical protein
MRLTFVNFLRALDPEHPIATQGGRTTTYLRRTRWSGAMSLSYVDGFLLLASTEEEALTLRQRLAKLLDRLGLLRHPTMLFWTPEQVSHHLGIDIDTPSCYIYAPETKLAKIAQHAR